LLFINNESDETSLVIVAQKLRNDLVKNGLQYLTLGEMKGLGIKVTKDHPVSIAGNEYY